MFSGIIEEKTKIIKLDTIGNSINLLLRPSFISSVVLGESISINGVCLTVAHIDQRKGITFNLSPETMFRTNFNHFSTGDFVNLERSVKLGQPLDGHLVYGHVDTTTKIGSIEKLGDYFKIILHTPSDGKQYLNEKGSISINGISLTINAVHSNTFDLMIIPHTWKVTNLVDLHNDAIVNIEYDNIAKIIFSQLKFLKNVK